MSDSIHGLRSGACEFVTVDIQVIKYGMSMAEATLVSWLVDVGALVERGQAVAEISTDKVEIQIEAPVSGRLIEQLVRPDEDFQVPGTIGRIESDEDIGRPL